METANLEGTEAEAELHVDVPLTARGIWHLIVDVVSCLGFHFVSEDAVHGACFRANGGCFGVGVVA